MKTAFDTAWKALAVTLATLAGLAVAQPLLFGGLDDMWDNPPAPAEMLPPVLLAMLLMVAVLVYPVKRSTLRGGRLVLAVFAAIFGLNVALTNVEAAVFLKMETAHLVAGFLHGTLQAALVAVLMVVAFGRGERPVRLAPAAGPELTIGRWTGRVALCSVCYMVLYFTAGLLIYSHIKPFYDTQDIPQGGWIFPLQLLRGGLYVAFALPLVRTLVGSRWRVALATAVAFPILAGAAGLLIPNPFMPDWVRPFHIVEIGWSNFVYGLLVGYLFWNPRAGASSAAEPASEWAPAKAA